VATLSVSTAGEIVEQLFLFSDSNPLDFSSLVLGDLIADAEIEITTVFDDPAAMLSLGLVSATGSILTTAQNNPQALGVYANGENFPITGPDQIRLQILPGASTQGAGRVVIYLKKA